MTPERLEEIRKRAEAASPGPWECHWDGTIGRPSIVLAANLRRVPVSEADAAFIAHARQDVPELVAEVERLRAAAEKLWDKLHPVPLSCRFCGDSTYEHECEEPQRKPNPYAKAATP